MSDQPPRENPAFRKDPGNVFVGLGLLFGVLVFIYLGCKLIWDLFS